jgi:hypothetical protein
MRDRKEAIIRCLERCGFGVKFDPDLMEYRISGWILPIKLCEENGRSVIRCIGLHQPYTLSQKQSEVTFFLNLLIHGQMPDGIKTTGRKYSKSMKPFIRSSLLIKQRGSCYWCRNWVSASRATIDHMIPLSQGGADSLRNLVVSCEICNRARGNRAIHPIRKVREQ